MISARFLLGLGGCLSSIFFFFLIEVANPAYPAGMRHQFILEHSVQHRDGEQQGLNGVFAEKRNRN